VVNVPFPTLFHVVHDNEALSPQKVEGFAYANLRRSSPAEANCEIEVAVTDDFQDWDGDDDTDTGEECLHLNTASNRVWHAPRRSTRTGDQRLRRTDVDRRDRPRLCCG
jgi:hypothetical protein